ncbi:MAG: nucleotidyltransferase domain-containing protein [Desulfobacteraceae bacterium]|nr:MAG: nucleotidyltransferase domain-containing protein [Desulfobacteraceae bacterium]
MLNERVRQVLERYEKVVFAYLFGSSAGSDAVHARDIDIAVYLSEKDKKARNEIKLDLYVTLSRSLNTNEVDVLVLNDAKNLILRHEIVLNGIVLLDRDRDLRFDYEQKIIHSAIDFRENRRAMMGV